MVHTETEKYIIKKYHQGYICSNFFSFILRCGATTTTGASDKKTFTSFLHFAMFAEITWHVKGGGERERERQQKKDEECFINYWIFFPFKDFFFRWRFYWKILFTCVLWKWMILLLTYWQFYKKVLKSL